jgi:probable F420-dependent oxidoreductase
VDFYTKIARVSVPNVRVDLMTGGMPLRKMQELAQQASASGHSGLVVTESGRTAYLSCAAAALAADIDLLTGVAVAFPRSPMVTASVAWELADVSSGRFRLGLGTQVRAHIERRYGAEFDPPGPRLRDYVGAVRAAFAAFRGDTKLDFHSEFYDLTLLPPIWSPGPIGVPDPPIDIAAVNPWMLRLAGSIADGVHIHPLNTTPYFDETVKPQLAEGARRAGRDLREFEVIAPAFVVVGDSEDDKAQWREMARTQVGFYGSTPNYGFIFEQLGHPGTTEALRERQKAGELAGMSKVITDDILRHFICEGTWATIADVLAERYAGRATRVVDYFGTLAWRQDPAHLERWTPVIRDLASVN